MSPVQFALKARERYNI